MKQDDTDVPDYDEEPNYLLKSKLVMLGKQFVNPAYIISMREVAGGWLVTVDGMPDGMSEVAISQSEGARLLSAMSEEFRVLRTPLVRRNYSVEISIKLRKVGIETLKDIYDKWTPEKLLAQGFDDGLIIPLAEEFESIGLDW